MSASDDEDAGGFASFLPPPPPAHLCALPWNVIDTIVAHIDSLPTLGRLASMHSCFDTALDDDPLWERLCAARYPTVHDKYRRRFVDSWRAVLRRECTRSKREALTKLVTEDAAMTGKQLSVLQNTQDLEFNSWWCVAPATLHRLATALAGGHNLCTLTLSGQALQSKDLDSVVTVARHGACLSTIDLSENRLKGDAGPRLAQIVGSARHLTSLSVASNRTLDTAAVVALAQAVPQSALKRLSLSNTAAGSDGVAAVLRGAAVRAGRTHCGFVLDAQDCGLRPVDSLATGLQELAAVETAPADDSRRALQFVVDIRTAVGAGKKKADEVPAPNKVGVGFAADRLPRATVEAVAGETDDSHSVSTGALVVVCSRVKEGGGCCVS